MVQVRPNEPPSVSKFDQRPWLGQHESMIRWTHQNKDAPSLESIYGHYPNFELRKSPNLLKYKNLPQWAMSKGISLHKQLQDKNDEGCLKNGSLPPKSVIIQHTKSRTMETHIPNSTSAQPSMYDHTLMARSERE